MKVKIPEKNQSMKLPLDQKKKREEMNGKDPTKKP